VTPVDQRPRYPPDGDPWHQGRSDEARCGAARDQRHPLHRCLTSSACRRNRDLWRAVEPSTGAAEPLSRADRNQTGNCYCPFAPISDLLTTEETLDLGDAIGRQAAAAVPAASKPDRGPACCVAASHEKRARS
jgi:hypothetical protein